MITPKTHFSGFVQQDNFGGSFYSGVTPFCALRSIREEEGGFSVTTRCCRLADALLGRERLPGTALATQHPLENHAGCGDDFRKVNCLKSVHWSKIDTATLQICVFFPWSTNLPVLSSVSSHSGLRATAVFPAGTAVLSVFFCCRLLYSFSLTCGVLCSSLNIHGFGVLFIPWPIFG